MWHERGRWVSLNLHRHRTSNWAEEARRVGTTGTETAVLNKCVLIGRRQHTVCVWSPEDKFRRGLKMWLSWRSACLAHTALTWISMTCHGAGYSQLQNSREQWKVLSACKTEVTWNPGSRKAGRRGKRKELSPRVLWGLELCSFPGLKDKLTNKVPLLTDTYHSLTLKRLHRLVFVGFIPSWWCCSEAVELTGAEAWLQKQVTFEG